ncbi:MAG: hypothetical protein Q8J78_06835 [Moraxellaceae bacterium]|nr:hypothetical protein [Moraxellaceae bacterium]
MTKKKTSLKNLLLIHELAFILLLSLVAIIGAIGIHLQEKSSQESNRISLIVQEVQQTRGDLYRQESFAEFRAQLLHYEPVDAAALRQAYFAAPEPQELIYEEIEAIWSRIDQADDWSAFEAKLAAIETARLAYGLSDD